VRYLETITVPLSELERFPGNARVHADAEIRESVRLGQYKSLLCRRMPDGQLVIVAGNGTFDAMESVRDDDGNVIYTEAQVEVWEYTDQEARRVNVSDNRLSDKARDDPERLAALLDAMEGDLVGTGFTAEDVSRLNGEEIMPPPGDAPVDPGVARWGVIVECSSEGEQVRLLGELAGQGLAVRAIMT
jgi:hypothetical protein